VRLLVLRPCAGHLHLPVGRVLFDSPCFLRQAKRSPELLPIARTGRKRLSLTRMGVAAKECRAHFRNQLLLAIRIGAVALRFREGRAVQTGWVPTCMLVMPTSA
jgi:hypothetical protein